MQEYKLKPDCRRNRKIFNLDHLTRFGGQQFEAALMQPDNHMRIEKNHS